jgi:hypothetical protein
MRKLILAGAFALISTGTMAQSAPHNIEPAQQPQMPPTMILPTQAVAQIYKYLGSRPADETRQLLNILDQCTSSQMPQNGAQARGYCPPVDARLEQDDQLNAKLASLQNEVDALKKPAAVKPAAVKPAAVKAPAQAKH